MFDAPHIIRPSAFGVASRARLHLRKERYEGEGSIGQLTYRYAMNENGSAGVGNSEVSKEAMYRLIEYINKKTRKKNKNK